MWDVPDNSFAWEFFESTGSIESYLLYKEYKKLSLEKLADEYNSDTSTGA